MFDLISATNQIRQAVGRGGANREEDVRTVQTLLREIARDPGEKHLDPGRPDGDCGQRTLRAIRIFQDRFLNRPDGRVDPGGRTLRNMIQLVSNQSCAVRNAHPQARDLVKRLLPHIGEKYVLGAAVPKYHPNWIGPWDCAEFVAWGIYQISGRHVGCRTTNAPNGRSYRNAYTGWFGQDLPRCAHQVDLQEAQEIPGVIALRLASGQGQIGHIAVSRGGNQTIEAAGRREGVASKRLSGRNWTSYWKLDFMRYDENACSFV